MSRSSFFFAVTLLVVAGSLAYMISFDRDHGSAKSASSEQASSFTDRNSTTSERGQRQARSSREGATNVTLPKSATSHLTPDQLTRVDAILLLTQRDARRKLDQLAHQYKLTKEQRDEVFPLIVAHHDQAHPAMIISGQALPSVIPGTTLEDSLSSVFDSDQQAQLTENSAAKAAWWEDIVGQLEGDLDAAIENGEMIPAEETSATPGVTISDEPSAGHGESSSHSGGNLFDLLGQ